MRAGKTDEFDALIVGSGISGVLIAKRLGEANKRVLILEAGQGLPPDINDYMNRFLTATAEGAGEPVPAGIIPWQQTHGSIDRQCRPTDRTQSQPQGRIR